jgi:hypothetical protein
MGLIIRNTIHPMTLVNGIFFLKMYGLSESEASQGTPKAPFINIDFAQAKCRY